MEGCIEEPKEIVIEKDTLLYLDGSNNSFRCSCGSNVFRPVDKGDGLLHYRCNGCGTDYLAER